MLGVPDTIPGFAADMLAQFRELAAAAGSGGLSESIESQIGLADSPGLVRHRLVQFRLYPDCLRTAAVYVSVLSSGFLRTALIPFPLRQFGVKVDVADLESPCASEIYIEPVSVRDARAWFRNGSALPYADTTIGYGVVVDPAPLAVEHYHWLNTDVEYGRRVELRTNLLTGQTDRYYRTNLYDDLMSTIQGVDISPDDINSLSQVTDAIESEARPGEIDPILIYSRKKDSAGVSHLAFYLTTATRVPESISPYVHSV